jgi:hypothetical protein
MESTTLASRCRSSLLAITGLLAVALTGLNHVSMPDATADLFRAPVATLATERAPAAVGVWGPTSMTTGAALAGPITHSSTPALNGLAVLAKTDPWALARLGHERYQRQIRDYTCVFLKQERIGGKLSDVQEIEVRFREQPKAVYMLWRRNADQAKRALFQDTPEFVNKRGEKVARVEPAGALIRLVVSDVLMPIHGKRAGQSSRRSIDEFGFRSTFELLDRYNQLGADRGVLDLRYEGEGEIDGRPTFKIVRYLPYDGPDGIWPDAKMVMHIDQEWLLPTAVYSYADRAGTELLGSYVHTKVKLNPGLEAKAFKF